jgi:outer membrane protein assembly factor BamB
MTTMPLRLSALVLFLTLSTGVARAEDWPQWRGPARTGHVPVGVSVPETLPGSPKVLWHIPLSNGLSSPVVSGGKVFYLDNQQNKETVHAADVNSGKVLWSMPLDVVHKDSQSPPGPRCTPVVDGERVYAQSCRGQLTCFGADDGKVIWQTNFVKDFGATFIGERGQAQGATRHGYNASPIVDGDHLIAEVGGRDGAEVVCFDKITEKVVWRSGDGTPGYASPLIADLAGARQLITFMADGVAAFDPADGHALWRVPVKTALGRHATTPLISGDIVCVASHQAGLIGIQVTKGSEGFSARAIWTAKDLAINFSSPVEVNGYLYGVGPRADLICVEMKTGKRVWSQERLFSGNPGNAYGGFVVMGERILLLTDGGRLILFDADPAKFHEIARAQVCGQNWCNPAYANGNLYLRDNRELWCVRLVSP